MECHKCATGLMNKLLMRTLWLLHTQNLCSRKTSLINSATARPPCCRPRVNPRRMQKSIHEVGPSFRHSASSEITLFPIHSWALKLSRAVMVLDVGVFVSSSRDEIITLQQSIPSSSSSQRLQASAKRQLLILRLNLQYRLIVPCDKHEIGWSLLRYSSANFCQSCLITSWQQSSDEMMQSYSSSLERELNAFVFVRSVQCDWTDRNSFSFFVLIRSSEPQLNISSKNKT